ENYLISVEAQLKEVAEIKHFKELRLFEKDNNLIAAKKEQQEAIPYKRFEVDGFEILVGKSSKANDELLRRYAWKEDLWLHAKDVSGSHVIVKYQSGQRIRSEEHTSELQSRENLVCRLL